MRNDIVPDYRGPQVPRNGKPSLNGLRASLFSIIASLSFCSQATHYYTIDGIEWEYSTQGDEASISGIPTSTTGTITIPSAINDYTVTAIEESAFSKRIRLSGVTIPQTVEKLGESVFRNCKRLEKVTIEGPIQEIPAFTFERCGSLAEVNIPDSVKTIGEGAFAYCSNLDRITIPDNVTSIEAEAFKQCHALSAITIPGNVKNIGEMAFKYNTTLESAVLQEGVENIGASVFYGCDALATLTLPSTVRDIPFDFVYLCKSLTSLNIAEDNPCYSSRNNLLCNRDGTDVLCCAPGLSNVIFPDTATNIGHCAFTRCNSIEEIAIPNGILRIGRSAFFGCETLTNVSIPRSLINIGDMAFSACDQLAKITVEDGNRRFSVRNGMLCNKNGTEIIMCPEAFAEAEIPHGTISISSMAFGYNAVLQKIVIPDSVEYISKDALRHCAALTEVYLSERYAGPTNIFPDAATIIRYSPAATISEDAVKAKVALALEDYVDPKMTEHITSMPAFVTFRDWLDRKYNQSDFAEWMKDSTNAWLAYALDSSFPILTVPRKTDFSIDGFERKSETDSLELSVSIKDIIVGEDASADNLSKILEVEGSTSLTSEGFNSDNVRIEFQKPEDGKIRITAVPDVEAGESAAGRPARFFLRVKAK